MGNIISSCCDKKSHTPYDPFIYDEEYEEYHSPNVLNPQIINTYNPPVPILLEQTNYKNSNSYVNSGIDIQDSYYTEDDLNKPYTTTTTTTTNNSVNVFEQANYQPFAEVYDDEEDDNKEDVTFDTNYTINEQQLKQQQQLQQQQNFVNNFKYNNNNNGLSPQTTLFQQQQQQRLRQSLQNSSNGHDKFYPHHENFTESVYMAQPPSTELGNTDSIMDSLVLGVGKGQPIQSQKHFNQQFLQPNINNTLNNQQPFIPQQHQQQQFTDSVTNSTPSSSVQDSIYYDTQNSFTN